MENEIQRYPAKYTITLLSGETILLECVTNENVLEEKDGNIYFDIESATYIQRLYDAFKNKELIKLIKRDVENRRICDATQVDRSFNYDNYYKIDSFSSCADKDYVATYCIKFQSI